MSIKKRNNKKSRRKKRVIILLIEIIVLLLLSGVGYAMVKYNKFQVVNLGNDDIKVNSGAKKQGYTTVALFGGDSREGALEEGTHTDCIIIAAINNKTKEVKMASVYRDTLTEQMNNQLKKANNAYFVGGPKDAINMLNKNFDLTIEDYATVDFKALADAIDLLGGIDIDVKEEEIEYINEFVYETGQVAKKEAYFVHESGVQTLDGVQATTYARIRSTAGGDYTRTERQRLVIDKVFEKAKKTNLKTLNKIVDKVFPQVSTSFTLPELVKLASGMASYKIGETTGFPMEVTDGNFDGVGSIVVPVGLVENVEELHEFLYPDKDYEVTETVKGIAAKIEDFTGITRADYVDPNAESGGDDKTRNSQNE